MAKDESKWRKFEKLVAALHAAEQRGATVRWNEKIGSRQFDVTVRFKAGLYEYLTVIECKDYENAVPVEKVDALATKARDAKADKAVMVSASGFQKGAIAVGEKHNIALLTLQSLQVTSHSFLEAITPILHLSGFRFIADTSPPGIILIPEERGVMRSLLREMKIKSSNFEGSPEELLDHVKPEIRSVATHTVQTFEIELSGNSTLLHPNTGQVDRIKSLCCEFVIVPYSEIARDEGYSNDPYLSTDVFEVKDVVTGQGKLVDFSRIEHGIGTQLAPGGFYYNPHLGFSYFCEVVNGEIATMILIESYQFGKLIQATYDQKVEYQTQFIEIENDKEIARLKEMLAQYRAS